MNHHRFQANRMSEIQSKLGFESQKYFYEQIFEEPLNRKARAMGFKINIKAQFLSGSDSLVRSIPVADGVLSLTSFLIEWRDGLSTIEVRACLTGSSVSGLCVQNWGWLPSLAAATRFRNRSLGGRRRLLRSYWSTTFRWGGVAGDSWEPQWQGR